MKKIFAVHIQKDLEKERLYPLFLYVSSEKKNKILKLRNLLDIQRSLVADILVRIIINEELGISNGEISFGKNQYNKPLLNNCKNFHFNISHSGEWIVCGIDYSPVGIDVEEIKAIAFEEIAKNYFTRCEFENLIKKSKDEQITYFYQLWTLKESFIKLKGEGLGIPLNSFSLEIKGKDIFFLSKIHENNIHFKQYKEIKNYELAACSINNIFPNSIIFKTIGEILREVIRLNRI